MKEIEKKKLFNWESIFSDMEPQTRAQLRRKGDVHKEIAQSLEVTRLTVTTFKPSTIRTIAQFRKSIPRVNEIIRKRKAQKENKGDSTSWWEVLTVMNCGFLFGMFVFFVGKCFWGLF